MCVICKNPGRYHIGRLKNLCDKHKKRYTCTDCGTCRYNVSRYGTAGYLCKVCSNNYNYCRHCCDYHHKDDMLCFRYDWVCKEHYGERWSACDTCGYLNENEYLRDGVCIDCHHDTLTKHCRSIGRKVVGRRFDVVKSRRWYGVEIETDNGKYDKVPRCWGIKLDASIFGLELVSPLMCGDEGLKSIRKLYQKVEPEFADDCGIHVHVDVRDLSKVQLFDLVKAFNNTKKTWFSKVSKGRWNNDYCADENLDPKEGEDWERYVERNGGGRYAWFNLQAIEDHGSIEIRLLEGCGVDKVCSWVTMVVNFVEQVVNMAKEMETCVQGS